MRVLLTLVAKLALSSALATRVLKSVILRVVLISSSCEFSTKGKAATANWASAAKALPKGAAGVEARAKMGQPHHALWNAWLKIVAAKGTEAQQKTCKDYIEYMTKGGLKQLSKEVKYVRLNKAWDPEIKKLELCFLEGSETEKFFEGTLLPIMIKDGKAREVEGVAPQGDLERKIQAALDEMK